MKTTTTAAPIRRQDARSAPPGLPLDAAALAAIVCATARAHADALDELARGVLGHYLRPTVPRALPG